ISFGRNCASAILKPGRGGGGGGGASCFSLGTRNLTVCATAYSQGHWPSTRSSNLPLKAPSMALRTVNHGNTLPILFESALEILRAVAVPSCQAVGTFSGNNSAAAIGGGGACSTPSSERIPAGISSPSTLAGAEVSHNFPSPTAPRIAVSINERAAFGVV